MLSKICLNFDDLGIKSPFSPSLIKPNTKPMSMKTKFVLLNLVTFRKTYISVACKNFILIWNFKKYQKNYVYILHLKNSI